MVKKQKSPTTKKTPKVSSLKSTVYEGAPKLLQPSKWKKFLWPKAIAGKIAIAVLAGILVVAPIGYLTLQGANGTFEPTPCGTDLYLSRSASPTSEQVNMFRVGLRPPNIIMGNLGPIEDAAGDNLKINALGYSPESRSFIGTYHGDYNGKGGNIYRIDLQGDARRIVLNNNNGGGAVNGKLPTPHSPNDSGYLVGDIFSTLIGGNGKYYVMDNGDTSVNTSDPVRYYIVDLETAQITNTITMANAHDGMVLNDWAFNPVDRKLYGFDNNPIDYSAPPNSRSHIVRITPGENTAETISVRLAGGTRGAVWFDAEGNFFMNDNFTGKFERVNNIAQYNDVNGQRVNQSDVINIGSAGTEVQRNDGASCTVFQLSKDVNPGSISAPGTVTYTYSLRNSANRDLTANFSDFMDGERAFIVDNPASITVAPNSGNSPHFGGACKGGGGSLSNNNRTMSIDNLVVSARSTCTFTVTVAVGPNEFNGTAHTIYNQARLTNVRLEGYGSQFFDNVTLSDWPGLPGDQDRTPLNISGGPPPPAHPFVTTEEGDVHSGGNLSDMPCFVPGAGVGTVRGQVRNGNGSYAAYVLSAGGNITDFGSAKQAAGSKLTFGNIAPNGRYGVICREDLAAKYLAPASPGGATVLNNNDPRVIDGVVSQSDLIGMEGVYVINKDITLGDNPNAVLNIVRGQHLTLVVRGQVFVNGRVNLSPGGDISPSDLSTIPAFGVVAQKNIYIHPAITELDGIYSAGTDPARYESGSPDAALPRNKIGTINTCKSILDQDPDIHTPSIVANADSCGNQLVVNGMMAARKIFFRRTVGDVANLSPSPAENIIFAAQVYLQPPPGFGSNSAELTEQGERPPVY